MTYQVIVADPPWPIMWSTPKTRVNGRGERHPNHKQDLGYPRMTIEAISNLNVGEIADDNCVLFLWGVDRFIMDGTVAAVAKAWGFTPKRFLIWKKSGFGLGTFPRPQHEIVLLATRGKVAFNLRNVGSVQAWPVVYEKRGASAGRRHSAKPQGFYDLVERACAGPYIDLFARQARVGWYVWGNEVESDTEVRGA